MESKVRIFVSDSTPKSKGRRIVVETPYELVDLCRSIQSGKWNADLKAWTYPADKQHAGIIMLAFKHYWPELDEGFNELCREYAQMKAFRSAEVSDLDQIEICSNKPWDHQIRGFNMVKRQDGTMLAWDMGTGKTACVVWSVINLNIDPVLIVCPSSVIDVWDHEFGKHSPEGSAKVLPLNGQYSIAERTRMADEFLAWKEGEKPRIIVMNYEAVWRKPFCDWAKKQSWGLIVADESHRIKSPSAKCSKFMSSIRDCSDKRVALSGTPMAGCPLDVYAQFRFLDTSIFGTRYSTFKNQYAIMGGFQGYEVLGYRNEDELNERFYEISSRVKKTDVLDLPPALHQSINVRLCKKARKVYDDLENNFVAEVEDGSITAFNALAKLLRLQQITSGYAVCKRDDNDEYEEVEIDSSKVVALGDIMSDLDVDEPLVVFTRFVKDIQAVKQLAAENKRDYYELSGSANDLKAWQESDKGDVLAVQIQAGGVGVDLTRSAYTVFYSIGFSLVDYEQALARNHRHGQKKTVTYFHLIAKDTVDETVYESITAKKNVVNSVLERFQKLLPFGGE